MTAANHVIIFDAEWNPALDEQAQDRSFRIGQRRNVTVHRLVASGTIDELKYLRQIYKLHLKQETFRSSEGSDALAPPRSFVGVEKDKHRKGELFGLENLLKFNREGSFIEKVWKSDKKHKGANIGSLAGHSSIELANAFGEKGETMLESENEAWLARETARVAGLAEDLPGNITEAGINLTQNNDDAFDHNDFFQQDRVEAAYDPEHFMGGHSQAVDDFVVNRSERGQEQQAGGAHRAAEATGRLCAGKPWQ